jgi:hypothetical protein
MVVTNPKIEKKAFRSMTFTCFSETSPDYEKLKGELRFLAYGKETCPTTNKQHWQGFAYSFKVQRLTAWKKLFPGAHIEQMKGNFRAEQYFPNTFLVDTC